MKFNFFKYINEDNKSKQEINEIGGTFFLAFAATNTLMMAYRFYKEYMTRASRACSNLKGRDKNLCMLKYEMDALEAKKSELERGLKDCDKAEDPKKCKQKIQKELRKTDSELKKVSKNFNMIYKIVKQEEEKERKSSKLR